MKKRAVLLLVLYVLWVTSTVYAGGIEYVNVSLHQSATASSAYAESNTAQMANDGINDSKSYTHWMSSPEDSMPWWQVDLNLDYEIHSIEIEAPYGSENSDYTNNFRVIGSRNDDFSAPVVLVPEVNSGFEGVFKKQIFVSDKVRYVRIEKTKSGVLSLGEVRVFIKRGQDTMTLPEDDAPEYNIAPSVAESVSSELPADVIGTEYEEDVSLLVSLGIMKGYEDGLFLPDKQISRSEFAKVAVLLAGEPTKTDRTTFADVPNGHWAHGYIEAAVDASLINGNGVGYFMPEEAITLPQATKILVSVLGYGDFAQKNGGYPVGYNSIASRIDLYDGISFSDGEIITRGQVASLVANALECPKLETTGMENGYLVNESSKDRTMLIADFGIGKGSGIVTASRGISLTSSSPRSEPGTLEIGGKNFVTDLTDTDRYLGLYVDYYYDLSEGNRIVAIKQPYNRNEVLTVSSEEIVSIKNYTISYGENKIKQEKISPKADVIYNGVAIRDYNEKDLIPGDGYLKLVNNDGKSGFDVCFVYDIGHYVVSWVNTENETIFVKKGEPIKLDMESGFSKLTKVSKSTGGVAMKILPEEVKENDVISVMASKNKSGDKVYNIIVCDDTINGEVTETGSDYLCIDDVKYTYTNEFDLSDVTVGKSYLWRLSHEGKIYCYDETKAGLYTYGYLIDFGEEDGFESALKFKIYGSDGKISVIEGAKSDKLLIDGYNFTDIASIKNHLIVGTKETGKLHQPIKYMLNGRGELIGIDTVVRGDEAETLTKDFDAKRRYYKSTGVIGMQFGLDNETVLIKVPEDITKENEFALMSESSFGNNQQYTMEAYDCGTDKIAGLVLLTGSTGGAAQNATLFMVDKLKTAVDASGEPRRVLTGLYRGEEVGYPEYDEGILDGAKLVKGDVVGLVLNESNEIKAVSKKFYFGDKPMDADEVSVSSNSPQYGNPYSTVYYGYGKVMSKKNGMISIEYANSDDAEYKTMMVNIEDKELSVYYYDVDTDKLILGDTKYIMDAQTVGEELASHVMINVDSGDVKELIIFN